MKNKIFVCYSSNRDAWTLSKFNKEIKQSIGCDYEIISFVNDGSVPLTSVYNYFFNSLEEHKENSLFVFCHHDIHFKTRGWGKNLLNIFNSNDVDIIGLAGTEKLYPHCSWWTNEDGVLNHEDLWGKVWHKIKGTGETKSDFTTYQKKCAKVQPVVAVDGVFLAFNPSTCLPFNEEFDGFHFYDVSWCLDNFKAGKKIAVTETISIVHESGGFMDAKWEENRKKMVNKYSQVFDEWPIQVKQ